MAETGGKDGVCDTNIGRWRQQGFAQKLQACFLHRLHQGLPPGLSIAVLEGAQWNARRLGNIGCGDGTLGIGPDIVFGALNRYGTRTWT